jgi:hypothetical protein
LEKEEQVLGLVEMEDAVHHFHQLEYHLDAHE